MPKAILVQVCELLADSQIAGTDYRSGRMRRFRVCRDWWHSRNFSAHLLERGLDSFYDIQERFINVRPRTDRFTVFGDGLKLPERKIMPVAGTQNNRNDSRF